MAPKICPSGIDNPREAVIEDYYNIVALAPGEFQFLSPVNLDGWRSDFIQWAISGTRIGEVGPGEGRLAVEIVESIARPTYYLLLDLSAIMLDVVRKKISAIGNDLVSAEYIKANIENTHAPKAELDRLFAINIFQDVEPIPALQSFRCLIKTGGLLRITVLAREAEDQFSRNSPCYDVEAGLWYSLSPFHKAKGGLPMGFIEIDGSECPFYRVQRFYTRSQITHFLRQTGFSVSKLTPIIFPIKYMVARWKSHNHYTKITDKQRKILNMWGGYFDGWDVEAYAS